LGERIPGIDKKIDKVVIVIVALSLVPMLIHYLQERRAAKKQGEIAVEEATH
jgi:hypothetical protein